MLGPAAVLLCLLAKATAQTLTTDAKCLSGYEWMYSSVNQSPCDVAAELAAVCVGGQFNLMPLDEGYVYLGPSSTNANSCRCSSVYYSMLSACARCQGRDFLRWSGYNANCTTVFVTVYNQQIPVGVKVPAYAYQNVTVSDTFNVTLAQSMKGESSRPPTSGTSTPVLNSKSPSSTSLPSSSRKKSKTNIPAIVGGVVGGLIVLGLIGALITFLVLRSKRKQRSQVYTPGFQQNPNMAFTPNATASLIPNTTSPHPGSSPSRVYDPNDPTTYPSSDPSSAHGSYNMYADPNTYANPADPYRQHSPFNPNVPPNYTGNSANYTGNSAQNYTGNSAQNYTGNQTMPVPQNPGRPRFTGAPEL